MYFDLHVNGYAGVDFNADDLQLDAMVAVCRRLRDDGVAGILATVITADLDCMCRRLQNVCRVREQDASIAAMIRGVHIEGPFINPTAGYVGAHPADAVLPADLDSMQRLLDATEGLTRIVTLAPECDSKQRVTKMLAGVGVTVSAGHCDPDSEMLAASIDAGLSMFTHLGNGCPLMLHRHDNIIQRVLTRSEQLAIGFIADGVHIPYAVLRNYLAVTGFERTFVVTDAIAAAGCEPGRFRLGRSDCRRGRTTGHVVGRRPTPCRFGIHYAFRRARIATKSRTFGFANRSADHAQSTEGHRPGTLNRIDVPALPPQLRSVECTFKSFPTSNRCPHTRLITVRRRFGKLSMRGAKRTSSSLPARHNWRCSPVSRGLRISIGNE